MHTGHDIFPNRRSVHMPFQHKVSSEKNIVVVKAVGDIDIMDVISETQTAISDHRGEGITRRLVDLTDADLIYSLEDIKKASKMLKLQAEILGTRKMAIVLSETTPDIDLQNIKSLLEPKKLKAGIFTNKSDAIKFLSEST